MTSDRLNNKSAQFDKVLNEHLRDHLDNKPSIDWGGVQDDTGAVLLALAETAMQSRMPFLGQWRDKVIDRAIRDKDQGEEFVQGYRSVGASEEEYCKRVWDGLVALHRVCLVLPLKKKKNSGEETHGNDNSDDFNKCFNKRFPDILPLVSESLRKYFNLTQIDGQKGTNDNTQEYEMTFGDEYSLRIWISCDTDGKELADRMKTKREEWETEIQKEKSVSVVRNSFFYYVVDGIHVNDATVNQQILSWFYSTLRSVGGVSMNVPTHCLETSSFYRCGILGEEGVVLLRNIDDDKRVGWHFGLDLPFAARGADSGETVVDHVWGGSIWLCWMLTLFQRVIGEDLANQSEKFVVVGSETTDMQGIRDLLKRAVTTEATLMHTKMSMNLDVESFYQKSQEVYDREDQWNNIRSQMEMISDYHEAKHAESQQERSKLFAMIVFVVSSSLVALTYDPGTVDNWEGLAKYLKCQTDWGHLLPDWLLGSTLGAIFLANLILLLFSMTMQWFTQEHGYKKLKRIFAIAGAFFLFILLMFMVAVIIWKF